MAAGRPCLFGPPWLTHALEPSRIQGRINAAKSTTFLPFALGEMWGQQMRGTNPVTTTISYRRARLPPPSLAHVPTCSTQYSRRREEARAEPATVARRRGRVRNPQRKRLPSDRNSLSGRLPLRATKPPCPPRPTIAFSSSICQSSKQEKVSAAFEGGLISSDGGLVLLREAERRLHLAGCIRDRRNQAQVVRSLPAMLRIRTRAIGCGYEDAGDCDALRVAPLFMYGCPRACKRHVKARACDRVRSCIRLQRCGALHGRGSGLNQAATLEAL